MTADADVTSIVTTLFPNGWPTASALLEAFFGLFEIDWVPWTLAGAIVVLAVVIWIDIRARKLTPLLRSVLLASERVKTTKSLEEFRAHFEILREDFEADRFLRDAWREFDETLIIPEPDAPDAAIKNTRRPSDYFDDSLLAAAKINFRLYRAIPNYLVGIGLFLTFLGLLAALYFASKSVGSGNVK
jgi:hypothetical protein